jgi:adenine-specific DNA-methyltransferase
MLSKLELKWIGKDTLPKLEPRILIEIPELSYGDSSSQNILIQGDNLLSLKALESKYNSKIKCIYIDPPYNTGSAFSHYDDGLEHSLWLSLLRSRILLLKNLLSEDGSIWINIDDNESHYLKVMCDEIFGRINFVSNIIWEKKSSPQNDAKWISDCHDHILVYAKNKNIWRPNKMARSESQNSIYKHSDEFDGIDENGVSYGRGPWFPGDMTVKTISQNCLYKIVTPSGKIVEPAKGRAWVYTELKFNELLKDNRISFGKSRGNKPNIKRFLSEIENKGIVPKSIWSYEEVGENRNARQEVLKFNDEEPFSTPKPEKLLERIISISTNENDLVLDCFLGSGTTSAVAHKLGRKWIGIELGSHAKTHCYPRLRAVVDGEQGGISRAVEWKGGGGFRFYTLVK